MSDISSLRIQIEQLVLEDAGFRAVEMALSAYCPFEALGMVNAEIRHSTFLASALDPYRPHGFGSNVLRQLLDRLLADGGSVPGLSRIRLHLADLESVNVRREWNRIDVLVVLADLRLVIALELKIGSGEGREQLKRYTRAVEQEWPSTGERPWTHLYFYLTRDGDEPSDPKWRAIDYGLVISTIDDVLKRTPQGDPLARSMLSAYASMMRRHHMEDPELIEIAQGLWQRHREALAFLMEHQPGGASELGGVIRERADRLAEAASGSKHSLIVNDTTRTMARFAVKEWDDLPGMHAGTGWQSGRLILLEVQVRPNRVRVMLLMGPGAPAIRQRTFEAVRSAMKRSNKVLSDRWTRFATQQLVPDNLLGEDFDPERAYEAVEQHLRAFVANELPKFDAGVRTALAST